MAKSLKSDTVALRKRIFLVEDHPVFREGLAQIVNAEAGLEVCGEAGSSEEAEGAIARTKPDLALVDITLPGKSGLELIKKLREKHNDLKLLVVSMRDEALYAARVLRAGGNGYVMKQEDPEVILHAIRDVLNGHIFVSEDVLACGAQKKMGEPKSQMPVKQRAIDRLTDLELEVLGMLGQGKSDGEIARRLKSSEKAVGAHCASMRKKLGQKNGNALIRYAVCWVETGGA